MLAFPNCKINIGLNIIEKRPDGFHNIETVFYPVPLCDALEVIIDHSSDNISLQVTGNDIAGDISENIIFKAYHLIKNEVPLPGLKVHLHKVIPSGAGLGGGSSDAAFFIKMLNELADLKLNDYDLHNYASKLGSDCSFFINNLPAFATQKGENLEPIEFSLKEKVLVLIKPDVFVSTAEAYAGVTPFLPSEKLYNNIQLSVEKWREVIINDFEHSIFNNHPVLKKIKDELYDLGAIYSSMSGSGSTIYGLFEKEMDLTYFSKDYFVWQKRLD